MIAVLPWLLVLASSSRVAGEPLPVRNISVSKADMKRIISVECPVGATTRLVFPQTITRAVVSPGARESLGLRRSSKNAVEIHPTTISQKGVMDVWLTSDVLTFELRAAEEGPASEIHFNVGE